MPSAAEIERHFASGAETITLTRAEWEAFYAQQKGYAATGLELRRAQAEIERMKRIARPLWRAVVRVRRGMAKTFERCPGRSERIPRRDGEEWERTSRRDIGSTQCMLDEFRRDPQRRHVRAAGDLKLSSRTE